MPLAPSNCPALAFVVFVSNADATTHLYTLPLHDALPISCRGPPNRYGRNGIRMPSTSPCGRRGVLCRSEEHTSELQSRRDLVCRLLLEKKKRVLKAVAARNCPAESCAHRISCADGTNRVN